GTKRLELMRQLLPANTSIAVMVNPDNPNADIDTAELQDAARTLGQSISFVKARSEAEIDAVFATFGERPGSALLVNTDPFFLARAIRCAGGTQWDHRDLRATRVRRGRRPDQLRCEPC